MLELLKGIKDDIWLLYINIANAFYNFFIYILEIFNFYKNNIFRKIDLELFKIYSVNDQFQVSITEGKKVNFKRQNLTYGETTLLAINKIMKIIKPKENDIFYDLGCGTGRICFFVNSFYKIKTYGIDLIPSFVSNANKVIEKFKLENVYITKNNWLEMDLNNGDIFYIAGTCFSEEIITELLGKLKNLKIGSIIISVSNLFEADYLKLEKSITLPFSWGKATVYILKVIEKPNPKMN